MFKKKRSKSQRKVSLPKKITKKLLKFTRRNRYVKLVFITLEKLPFFNYITRLIEYVFIPSLTGRRAKKQLDHSFLDLF